MSIVKTDVYDVQVGLPLDIRTVKTDVGARNNIPMAIRYPGLIVYTRNENAFWYWPQGGSNNDSWVQLFLTRPIPTVYFGDTVPASNFGSDGDVYFVDTVASVDIYQKAAGDWGMPLGSIPKGVSMIKNNSLTFETSASTLNSLYPSAKPGDVVYSENASGSVEFIKRLDGNWSMQSITII